MSNTHPNQYEDKELRAVINKIYNEAVMMGRLRTGSPITHVEDSVLQLITQNQLEARIDELSAVVSVIRSQGSSARLVISIKQMEDRLAELKKGLQP